VAKAPAAKVVTEMGRMAAMAAAMVEMVRTRYHANQPPASERQLIVDGNRRQVVFLDVRSGHTSC
jgi:hypothetical protein